MERLHGRVRLLWTGRAVVAATVLAAVALAVSRFLVPFDPLLVVVGWVLLVALGAVHAVLRHRRWGYDLEDDALALQRGVLTHVDTAVPYVRVQHTDTQRGPVERALGLASVVVYTAGTRGADIRIPGLPPERAERLQGRLRELTIESEPADAV